MADRDSRVTLTADVSAYIKAMDEATAATKRLADEKQRLLELNEQLDGDTPVA